MTEPHPTIQGWIQHLTHRTPLHQRLALALPGCSIEIRSDSQRLLEKLAFYYKDFLDGIHPGEIRIDAIDAPPPRIDLELHDHPPNPNSHPGAVRIKEQYTDLPDGRLIRKRNSGLTLFLGHDRHLACGPCLEHPNQLINFINSRYVERHRHNGWLLGHAAAVADANHGLALTAHSNRGKSTLALELLSRGLSLVSNDRLLIRRLGHDLRMRGVPKLPRVNPGTLLHNPNLQPVLPTADREAAAQLSPDELWKLEQKHDVFIDQCFGPGRFNLNAHLNALVVLNWSHDAGPTRLRRLDSQKKPDALRVFIKSHGVFGSPHAQPGETDPTLDDYGHALQHCPVYELTGGIDFNAAVDACLEILRDGVMPPSLNPAAEA